MKPEWVLRVVSGPGFEADPDSRRRNIFFFWRKGLELFWGFWNGGGGVLRRGC